MPWILALALLLACRCLFAADYDIVVYGGTAAGVVAAVQAKRMGKSVIVVSPDKHLGGLSSGGLGFTDTGNKAVIGGLSRDFYHRIWKHYEQPAAWKWQKKAQYGNKGQGTAAIEELGQDARAIADVLNDEDGHGKVARQHRHQRAQRRDSSRGGPDRHDSFHRHCFTVPGR